MHEIEAHEPVRSCYPVHIRADIEADDPGLRNAVASPLISHPSPFHKNITIVAKQCKKQLLQNACVRPFSQGHGAHRVRTRLSLNTLSSSLYIV